MLLRDPAIGSAIKRVLEVLGSKAGKRAAQQSAECIGVLLREVQKQTASGNSSRDMQQVYTAVGVASVQELEQEVKVHLSTAYNRGENDRCVLRECERQNAGT